VSENYRALFGAHGVEIVGIHDARSLAQGYNRGIACARGEQIILSHDDIEIVTPDFADRLHRHLEQFDLIGVAGTTRLVTGKWESAGDPYAFVVICAPVPDSVGYVTVLRGGGPLVVPGIQALDGVFMAMRRRGRRPRDRSTKRSSTTSICMISISRFGRIERVRAAVCRDIVLNTPVDRKFDAVWADYRRRFEGEAPHAPSGDLGREDRRARDVLRDDTRRDTRTLRSRAPRELADQIGRANAGL
jgi:hypothetical protein